MKETTLLAAVALHETIKGSIASREAFNCSVILAIVVVSPELYLCGAGNAMVLFLAEYCNT